MIGDVSKSCDKNRSGIFKCKFCIIPSNIFFNYIMNSEKVKLTMTILVRLSVSQNYLLWTKYI